MDKVFISAGLASRSSFRSSQWWRVVRTRCRSYRVMVYVHVLLIGAGVDTVPLVDVDLRDVLPANFLEVVWNRFLMLLLDLPMWW